MYNIFDRFRQIEENFYLDSMTDTDQNLTEQSPEEGEEQVDKPQQAQPQPQVQQQIPPEQLQQPDPNAAFNDPYGGQDPSMIDGMDPYGQPVEIKTSTELGRIYELNKIYYRLYTINKFLKNVSDEKLQSIKKMVSEAFDIYRLILNNIDSYKDKVDDIILKYYEFISNLVLIIDDYYKNQYQKIEKNNKEQNYKVG